MTISTLLITTIAIISSAFFPLQRTEAKMHLIAVEFDTLLQKQSVSKEYQRIYERMKTIKSDFQEKNFERCLKKAKTEKSTLPLISDWVVFYELSCARNLYEKGVLSGEKFFKILSRSRPSRQCKDDENKQTVQAFLDGALSYREREAKLSNQRAKLLLDWMMEQKWAFSLEQKAKIIPVSNKALTTVVAFKKEERLEASEEELTLFDQVESDFGKGETLLAVAGGVKLMKKFPAGKRALRIQERIVASYLALSATSPLRSPLLQKMQEGDCTTILAWGKRLFDRLYYNNSLSLLEQAIDKCDSSGRERAQGDYLIGVLAFYLGQYDKAQSYLSKVAIKSAGSERSVRSRYWLAMTALHQQDYQTALEHFERLLQLPHSEEYEQNAAYWRWRSLQQLNRPEEAKRAAQLLIDRFPLSFYALKARMESNNGVLFDNNFKRPLEKIEGSLLLSDAEVRAWKRYGHLLFLGWYEEAQSELSFLTTPVAPEMQLIYAKLYSLAHHYRKAIEMMAPLWKEDKTLLRKELLQMVFPLDFHDTIKKESQQYQLDPLLIHALIRQESAYTPSIASSKGALGLMQILPSTGEELMMKQTGTSTAALSIEEKLLTPTLNIKAGTLYLSRLLKKYEGDVAFSLAAYNAGMGRLQRFKSERGLTIDNPKRKGLSVFDELWIDELPWSETQDYVKAVLRNQLLYKFMEK
ncbi:MAG: transglycosylase SLT domain-containing protein [Oligoflexia bacterium]|nr:transglycosylase SLT domain-containing protein [Oligoflexia bacterium]